jgi:hypothetical protein
MGYTSEQPSITLGGNGYCKNHGGGWGYNSQIVFKLLPCSSDQTMELCDTYLLPRNHIRIWWWVWILLNYKYILFERIKSIYCKEKFNNLSYFQIKFVQPQKKFKKKKNKQVNLFKTRWINNLSYFDFHHKCTKVCNTWLWDLFFWGSISFHAQGLWFSDYAQHPVGDDFHCKWNPFLAKG